jgi:hypothetical protein
LARAAKFLFGRHQLTTLALPLIASRWLNEYLTAEIRIDLNLRLRSLPKDHRSILANAERAWHERHGKRIMTAVLAVYP